MPSLSLIEVEAQRLIGSLPEKQRSALQNALVELCETHWQELRGPVPASPLAQALWSITPPWADLVIDLYAGGDARLDDIVPKHSLARGMALLVLAEIERGNEVGIHIAHDPMMAFEVTLPPAAWLERISSLLRGTLLPPPLHLHNHHAPLWKALAVIAAHTRRIDLPAVLQVISLLFTPHEKSSTTSDEALETLRHEVQGAGIRFLGRDDDHILLEQHDHAHKPVRTREVGEMLLEIRQQWLR